jgi:hypothetical protein
MPERYPCCPTLRIQRREIDRSTMESRRRPGLGSPLVVASVLAIWCLGASSVSAAPGAGENNQTTVHVIFSSHLVCGQFQIVWPPSAVLCRRQRSAGRSENQSAANSSAMQQTTHGYPPYRSEAPAKTPAGSRLHTMQTPSPMQDVGFTDMDNAVIELHWYTHYPRAVRGRSGWERPGCCAAAVCAASVRRRLDLPSRSIGSWDCTDSRTHEANLPSVLPATQPHPPNHPPESHHPTTPTRIPPHPQIQLARWFERHGDGDGFRYLTHSWLISLFFDCPAAIGVTCPLQEEKDELAAAITKGYITWHAAPFNPNYEVGWADGWLGWLYGWQGRSAWRGVCWLSPAAALSSDPDTADTPPLPPPKTDV